LKNYQKRMGQIEETERMRQHFDEYTRLAKEIKEMKKQYSLLNPKPKPIR